MLRISEFLERTKPNGKGDDPVKLASALAELEAQRTESVAAIEAIPAQRRAALMADDDATLDTLDREAEKHHRMIEKVDALLPTFRERLDVARAVALAALVEKHRAAAKAIAAKLDKAIEAALAANAAAQETYDVAFRELGGDPARHGVARVVFGGILARDLVDLWRADMARTLDPPVPVTAPPVQRAAPLGRPVATAMTPRAVRLDEPPPQPKPTARPPRVLQDEVPAGHRRCRVVRSGYPDESGAPLARGDEVDLPDDVAVLAAGNGAVELVQPDVGSAAA